MLDNANSQDNMLGQQLTEGTPVYDVNGNKVGTVNEQGVQGDNLVLQKGLFFPHDYYVPLRAIMHVDADGIYLNVTKDDVTNQTFDNAVPEDAVGSASVFSDTATSYQATEHEVFGDRVAEGMASHTGYMGQQTEYEIGRDDTPIREGDVRVPVRGDAIDVGPDAFTERDFDIPLRGEEVVANKEARVAEEVRFRKQQITEDQRVSDTVRKERVRIEGGGIDQGESDAPLSSDTAAYEQNTDDVQPRHDI